MISSDSDLQPKK
ncbi:unnamed protein product, partial [Allacma fusca]